MALLAVAFAIDASIVATFARRHEIVVHSAMCHPGHLRVEPPVVWLEVKAGESEANEGPGLAVTRIERVLACGACRADGALLCRRGRRPCVGHQIIHRNARPTRGAARSAKRRHDARRAFCLVSEACTLSFGALGAWERLVRPLGTEVAAQARLALSDFAQSWPARECAGAARYRRGGARGAVASGGAQFTRRLLRFILIGARRAATTSIEKGRMSGAVHPHPSRSEGAWVMHTRFRRQRCWCWPRKSLADTASRRHCPRGTACRLCRSRTRIPQTGPNALRTCQLGS